mmetsp:Transcript_1902/g.4132  ORF Transcript_1902/g.4132 Transcript_1902/m.4132 type:complete len:1580 (+) Transcript_1902:91-4830(+)
MMNEFEFEFNDDVIPSSAPPRRSPGGTSTSSWASTFSSPSPRRTGYGSRRNRPRKDIKELDVIFSPEDSEEVDPPLGSPSLHENEASSAARASPSSSVSSKPVMPKGRTAKRRNRKLVRTGAMAIKEAEDKLVESGENDPSDDGFRAGEESHIVKEGAEKDGFADQTALDRPLIPRKKKNRKRRLLDLQLSRSGDGDSKEMDREVGIDGAEAPLEAPSHSLEDVRNKQSESDSKNSSDKENEISLSSRKFVSRGRRHKRPKASRSTPTSLSSWDICAEGSVSFHSPRPNVAVNSGCTDLSTPTSSHLNEESLSSSNFSRASNAQKPHSTRSHTPTSNSNDKSASMIGSNSTILGIGSRPNSEMKVIRETKSIEINTPLSDSKSVRFSLSSNTSHFYETNGKKHYGTPPGSPAVNATPSFASGADSFRSDGDAPKLSESNDSNTTGKAALTMTYGKSTLGVVGRARVEKKKSIGDNVKNDKGLLRGKTLLPSPRQQESSSAKPLATTPQAASYESKLSPIDENLPKKLPPSCLKPKSIRFYPAGTDTNGLSTPDSSPSSKSTYSASSHGSSICRFTGMRKKKHRSRRFNLGNTAKYTDFASEDSSGRFETYSPDVTPNVSLGRPGFCIDASAVQDAGNVRMLIDDLSYLCSAILQCKSKSEPGMHHNEVICTHNSVTAGAACDLAEIVSQAETRIALLTLGAAGSKKSNGAATVGALGAVLEALACVPPVTDVSEICRDVVGVENVDNENHVPLQIANKVESEVSAFPLKSGSTASASGGRTKNARRKQNQGPNRECDNVQSIDTEPLKERAKYDVISSNALSLVGHFIGVDCVGSERSSIRNSGQIDKSVTTAARKTILQHKTALQGLARLSADDPLVLAYLRQAILSRVSPVSNPEDVVPKFTSPCPHLSEDEESSFSVGPFSSQTSELSIPSTLESSQEENPTTSDPTKSGRRKSRKKKQSRLVKRQSIDITRHLLAPISESDKFHPSDSFSLNENLSTNQSASGDFTPLRPRNLSRNHGSDFSGRSNTLDFLSEDGISFSCPKKPFFVKESGKIEKVDITSDQKLQEKITTAVSRAKLISNVTRAGSPENVCPFCCSALTTMINLSDSYDRRNNGIKQENALLGYISPAKLALGALDCVISGRDKSKLSSGDDGGNLVHEDGVVQDGDDDEQHEDDFLGMNVGNTWDDMMMKNPILFRNEMIRESGSLPLFSRSMTSTLSAILLLCNSDSIFDEKMPQKKCESCFSYLQERVSSLSEIIENLCCLSPEVSKALSQKETLLVPSLLRVVEELSGLDDDASYPVADETLLAVLNTLTSLTHENPLACAQLISPHFLDFVSTKQCIIKHKNGLIRKTGLDIILTRLIRNSRSNTEIISGAEKFNEKSRYDSDILCLNILTNVVEMVPHPTKATIVGMTVTNEASDSSDLNMSAVAWLSRWIVSKTSGFRKSVMKGTFGSAAVAKSSSASDIAESNDDYSELKAGEEGNLVTAGNGFVLLSYLMLNDNSFSSQTIQDIVIGELPIDEDGTSGGIQFMIKTMKAFCNFYHYSVGDLSVAVISPIIKLIAGLEKLDFTRNCF